MRRDHERDLEADNRRGRIFSFDMMKPVRALWRKLFAPKRWKPSAVSLGDDGVWRELLRHSRQHEIDESRKRVDKYVTEATAALDRTNKEK